MKEPASAHEVHRGFHEIPCFGLLSWLTIVIVWSFLMYRKLASALMFAVLFSALGVCAQPPAPPNSLPAQIKGDYLETRSADVYVGQCFANGEMNTAGQEA